MTSAEIDALHRAAFGHAGAHGWHEADFERALTDKSYTILAREGGYAVARVIVDEAELMLIGTSPRTRRQGAGSAILADLEAMLAAKGARRLMLEVSASNLAAVAFYRARGFQETGARPGYYGPGGRAGHAALLFEKALKT